MSTLTIDLISSLDDFAAAEDWPSYWGKEGPELFAWLEEKLAEDHVIVMGANTYRTMSQIVAEELGDAVCLHESLPGRFTRKSLYPPRPAAKPYAG